MIRISNLSYFITPTMAKGEDSSSTAVQSKKTRTEDEHMQDDATTKPLQLQRRRVWRACESCRYVLIVVVVRHSSLSYTCIRRKKIKCDGCEPTCSQCSMSNSQCTWLQTKDRAALSRQYVLDCSCLTYTWI